LENLDEMFLNIYCKIILNKMNNIKALQTNILKKKIKINIDFLKIKVISLFPDLF